MGTTLTPGQEAVVVSLRTTLLLPTDDLLAITREFINPAVSRAGLGRCLRRHGVSHLTDLVTQESGGPATKKTFKDYEPGFIHIDIKYLPQMPGETARRYLFVAIDRATRWVFMEIYADQSDASSVDFLSKVKSACPVNIVKLLTDNGSQFTDSEIVGQTRFASAVELESTLRSYLQIYNNSIPQRALNHMTPIQALKDWQAKKPELFVKSDYNQANLERKPMTAFGRPRGFDRDAALNDAMLVFWRKGFLATSMIDLCEAMDIRSPSLYAAFGSKESLYIEAIERYVSNVRPLVWGQLEVALSARAGIEALLQASSGMLPGVADFPSGCMVTLASEECPGNIVEAVRRARLDGLALIRGRLERAVASGELPKTTDLGRLSRFYLGVFQGMAIQARDGASPEELAGLVDVAMAAWPVAME